MFILNWLYILAVRLVLIVLGLVVVPLALPWRRLSKSVSDGRDILVLPDWAWLWSNDFDGSLGDKRGWWAKNAPFGLEAGNLFCQFWWLAIRNPVNNFRLTPLGSCPVAECDIEWSGDYLVRDMPGGGGARLSVATHRRTGKRWHGFYLVHEWSSTRALVIRLGFKIEPWHENSREPAKGFTFKINPFKQL